MLFDYAVYWKIFPELARYWNIFALVEINFTFCHFTGKYLLSKNPGEFKNKNNRAGEIHFVDHMLVKGTLIKGFDFYQALTAPFAKAAYMMFLISEVHPFLDGNGRIARVMMNAELVKTKQCKIIIPTVYREDYMGALRRLTRQQDLDTYIRMLQRANEFSETITGNDMEEMDRKLRESNAIKEYNQAKLKIANVK